VALILLHPALAVFLLLQEIKMYGVGMATGDMFTLIFVKTGQMFQKLN
jgi:hypothetical protein